MSVNYIDKSTGDLIRVAGQSKAEYGASTVRSGYLNAENLKEQFSGVTVLDLEHQSVQYAITFSTPMPDNDYIVICDVHNTSLQVEVAGADKTKNGFIVTVRNLVATMRADRGETTDSFTFDLIDNYFNYTAFKLYTDTEYNNLLDLPDRVETLETTTSGNISGATTNSGTITSAIYARSGNVVQLRLTLTGASLTTHGNTTLTITMPSTVPVPVMTVDGVANIWNGSVDEVGHVRMSGGSRNVVIYSSNDSGADADITDAEVWATVTYITQ